MNCTNLLNELEITRKLILAHTQSINNLRLKIVSLESQLYEQCPHVWERDLFAPFDDIHKFVCKHCNLSK